jgi:hypothetical protein
MVHLQSALQHHLFEVSVAECITKLPSHTKQNDVGLEMTPFKRMLLCHDESSCSLFSQL